MSDLWELIILLLPLHLLTAICIFTQFNIVRGTVILFINVTNIIDIIDGSYSFCNIVNELINLQ